jgi:hypothetical protein
MTAYITSSAFLLWHLGPTALHWTWWGTTQVIGGAYWLLFGPRNAAARHHEAVQHELRALFEQELHLARVNSQGKLVLADEEYRDMEIHPLAVV